MAPRRSLSRRAFLRTGVGVVGLGLLSACAPPPAAPPTPAGASKPAAPTTAPAGAAPTTAAAAPASGQAAPTTAPTKPEAAKPEAAKPAAKPADSPGAQYIGKLEGPEVVTDAARFPKAFKEAPDLAALVQQGKLPPVQERIGQDPLVIKPLHEIGNYGGTWRRGFTGPADQWNGYRAASGPDNVLFWDYTGDQIVPNVAKGYELSPDGKTTTIMLRRGMKWSDGTPFTADAFTFWYEDMLLNKELNPNVTAFFQVGGKPGRVEKVDDHTVRFVFEEAYYLFPAILAGATSLSSHSYQGDPGGVGCFAPGHYLKQYLPKYTPQDRLDQMVREGGFDNWVNFFKFKNSWQLNSELPAVTPWKTTQPINTPTWTLERNPYSIWVDTDGNQLPYFDRVQMTLAENLEVLNLRAVAGEYDIQERHVDIGKLPVILENQQRGNYRLHLDTADYGADCGLKFNLTFDADPEVAKWISTTDFRRAVALGIDRDQINETFWLGTGTPGSTVPRETNKYNPGPEYRTRWATYEPDRANQMLDALGLTQKDAEGFRLRTDGRGRLSLVVTTWGGQFVQFTQIAEMIREQWKRIGLDLQVQEIERSLGQRRNAGNETQIWAWQNDGSDHLYTFPNHVFPYLPVDGSPHYAQWFQTNGEQGKEPPDWLKDVMLKFKRAFGVPEAEQVRLGKEIWATMADNVMTIGVVGLGAATMGVRIAKNNVGNQPSRQYNSPDVKTPATSRTMTFFFKS